MNIASRMLRGTTLALVVVSGATQADTGKTREQVRAELEAAQKASDVPVGGESSLTLRELYPGLYPVPETARGFAHSGTALPANEAR